jgi:hypothetical protein
VPEAGALVTCFVYVVLAEIQTRYINSKSPPHHNITPSISPVHPPSNPSWTNRYPSRWIQSSKFLPDSPSSSVTATPKWQTTKLGFGAFNWLLSPAESLPSFCNSLTSSKDERKQLQHSLRVLRSQYSPWFQIRLPVQASPYRRLWGRKVLLAVAIRRWYIHRELHLNYWCWFRRFRLLKDLGGKCWYLGRKSERSSWMARPWSCKS